MDKETTSDHASPASRRAPVALPGGGSLDPHRPRSEGPLDGQELSRCRAERVPLAYDPAQVGWVTADCEDDLAPWSRDVPRPVGVPAAQAAEACRFRPWRDGDLSVYVALLDDPNVWRHMPEAYPGPLTPEVARALIELSNGADHHEVLAVEWSGQVVGQVRLAFAAFGGDRTEGEISYWLGERFWGRGIGSEIVRLYTRRCFQRWPELRSISARVHEDNPASSRILEKSRYRQVGPAAEGSAWRIHRAFRDDA